MSGRRSGIPRRTFLRGAGAALGLPLLDAMLPRALADAPRPLRLVFVFLPNGVHRPAWRPASEGPLEALPFTLEPLAAHRQRVLVLSGLTLDGGRAHGDGPGDHARAGASFLTGAHPRKTGGADIECGVSVDQVAAPVLGRTTRFPSLELGTEPSAQSGACDSGYSCAYSSNISWRTPSTPLAKLTAPRRVFERLFGDGQELSPAERAARDRARRSVLDLAGEDAARLRERLGARDREKLDEYATAVREVEQRIERAAAGGAPAPDERQRPPGRPADYGEHLRLLYDLTTLALQADLTRVVTIMAGNAGSNRSYHEVEVPEGHHDLSHHGGDAQKQEKLRRINRFHVQQLAHLLDRLAATREGDGTLLDRTLIVFGSGLGDGDRHDHHDLPILLCGGGGVASGRHVRYPDETPLCGLYLWLLRRAGVSARSFGDASQPLTGLA